MAFALTPIDSGSVDVNGIPYRRQDTFATFEKDSGGVPTGRMSLTAYYAGLPIVIFPFTPYAELINGSTTLPFASLAELVAFVTTKINPQSGTGGTGNTTTLSFAIVAGAPANANQKTAGATIQDGRLIGGGYTVASMVIRNDTYTGSEISYNNATGVIGQNPTNPTTFQPGDTVVIFVITA